jgi:hypothetical protein
MAKVPKPKAPKKNKNKSKPKSKPGKCNLALEIPPKTGGTKKKGSQK